MPWIVNLLPANNASYHQTFDHAVPFTTFPLGPFYFGVPLPRLTFIEESARQEVLAGKAQPLGTQFEEFWGAGLWANLALSSP